MQRAKERPVAARKLAEICYLTDTLKSKVTFESKVDLPSVLPMFCFDYLRKARAHAAGKYPAAGLCANAI